MGTKLAWFLLVQLVGLDAYHRHISGENIQRLYHPADDSHHCSYPGLVQYPLDCIVLRLCDLPANGEWKCLCCNDKPRDASSYIYGIGIPSPRKDYNPSVFNRTAQLLCNGCRFQYQRHEQPLQYRTMSRKYRIANRLKDDMGRYNRSYLFSYACILWHRWY